MSARLSGGDERVRRRRGSGPSEAAGEALEEADCRSSHAIALPGVRRAFGLRRGIRRQLRVSLHLALLGQRIVLGPSSDGACSSTPRGNILPSLDAAAPSRCPHPAVVLSDQLRDALAAWTALPSIVRSISSEEDTLALTRIPSSLQIDLADVAGLVARVEDLECGMLREEGPNGRRVVREGVEALLSAQ